MNGNCCFIGLLLNMKYIKQVNNMIKKFWHHKAATLAATLLVSLTACGNDSKATEPAQAEPKPVAVASNAVDIVTQQVVKNFGERPSRVVPAPMPGYQMAVTSQGNFFVSNDGQYMVYGRVFDLNKDMLEVTNNGLNAMRAEQLQALKDDAIVFPAKGKEKHKVYVFTDITCGYCRKMHRQIEEYQQAGISVHYLAFPRSPENASSMQKIWCADDPAKAMSDAKLNSVVTDAECTGKEETVAMQHDVGISFGVRGTPATVLVDGALMPGYRPPADLLKLLESSKTQ